MLQRKLIKGYFFVIFSAALFGCMALITKNIYADGVNSLSAVFLRGCLSLPILAILAWRQSGSLKVQLRSLTFIGFMGFMGCGLTPLLLFSSYHYMASGTATVFHFVYPAMVLVLGILFAKTKLQKSHVLCVSLCLLGIFMFYDPAQPVNLTGCILALLSGLTYALYIFLLSVFPHKNISGFLLSFYITLICTGVMLVVCLVTNQLVLPHSFRGWLFSMILALVINIGAVVLFQQGTFLIGGERSSIFSTVEPITSVLVGYLAFQEPVGIRTLIGTVFVILASILIAVFDLKQNAKTAP